MHPAASVPVVLIAASAGGVQAISTIVRSHYVDGRRIRHLLCSANPLFDSSAAILGSQAIAVVLTGSGMDATDGVQSIKAHGGTVIAQDEATSEHFGMPSAAIRTGAVDHVLPIGDIVPTLMRLVAERQAHAAPSKTA